MAERLPKTLFVDIETFPIVGKVWGIWQQNVIKTVRWSTICAFDAKWYGEKQHITKALPDYRGYKPGEVDDEKIVRELWELLNEADIVVAHNGDEFDIKVMNARFIKHGLPPPAPFKTVDTKKAAKLKFRFGSNRLNDLADYLGLGRKEQTGGFDLWEECLAGNMKAWAHMKKYNKQDVNLLEAVYVRMLPWMDKHPNVGLWMGGRDRCQNCGSLDIQYRGRAYAETRVYRRFQCNDCWKWNRSTKSIDKVQVTHG